MAGQDLTGGTEADHDGPGGVGMPDHHGVADRLDELASFISHQLADGAGESARELGRVFVAVRLSQRGVAGDVGEDEGARLEVVARTHAPKVIADRRTMPMSFSPGGDHVR
jgi:hypothetical protein